MQDPAQELLRAFPAQPQLFLFANRLNDWLLADLESDSDAFTESRARALLLAGDLLDDPTRNSFAALVGNEPGVRLAIYDLLRETGLAENEDVQVLAARSAQGSPHDAPTAPPWLALIIAGYAWRADFLLEQLDPASPPAAYSPAGQILKRAAYFARQQVQRSATDRDKLYRQIAFQTAAGGSRSLDSLQPDGTIAPLPPYFRPPIPERYPEYARETVQVDPNEVDTPPAPTRGEPIRISESDLDEQRPQPSIQPTIRIEPNQVAPPAPPAAPAPQPPPQVVLPPATANANTTAPRPRGRRRPPTKTTKLRVLVQERPDGPGLYGLQIRVSAPTARQHLAGTSNEEGVFTCELPVYADVGLTYDVDVTWPRDFGGDVERKSITLNADRTMFVLPFYRQLKA
jgi:hypothetical protein